MTAPPIRFVWDGASMVPIRRHHNLATASFNEGEEYQLVIHEDRSAKSHSHEFAWLNEAWKNLPEHLADDYPTAEHLRKRALIQAGYCNEEIIDAGSNAAALRVASSFRKRDDFLLVIVRGPFVVIREAKSQSHRAMDRKDFGESKQAILEIVSAMIGVDPGALQSARAA